MPAGRPRKPLEQKRRAGRSPGRDSGGRALPAPLEVVALPAADGIPQPPNDILLDGRHLWEQVWTHGQRWISVTTDMAAVEEACRLTDDLAQTRKIFRLRPDPQTGRLIVALTKELGAALGRLGFDPASRSRLGVAEVKAATALDRLFEQRAKRG